ncbi:MAG: hypothetical protein U1B78_00695 [Dehalococcoidia bacterium]|nr:hypothetical protein [Dehalococcoidia bacterium]
MAEVLAGFVCGYGLALAATPAAALALLRARRNSALLARTVPEGTSLVAVSIILHTFAFLIFTAIGIALGLLLAGLEERSPAGGLGSPNRAFTAFVLLATAIAVIPISVTVARLRVPLLAGGLLFAGVFGWLMPFLSLLGPD